MTEVPRALWEGYVAPDELTMLAGHEKIGKTTLLEGLTRAMARGDDFLGHATTPATALWVSEEAPTAFARREGELGPAPARDVVPRREAMRLPWDALVEHAWDAALEGGHGLVVFDSFLKLSGLDRERESENDASTVSGLLRPLLLMPEGVAVVFVHHLNRKGYVRGSGAFGASVDTSVRLLRRERATAFDLRADARNPRTPKTLRGDLDRRGSPWRYVALGEGGGASSAAVWDAVKAAGPNGATVEELVAASGATARTVKNCLRGYPAKDGGRPGWLETGRVARTGAGMAGDPYRYAAAEDDGFEDGFYVG